MNRTRVELEAHYQDLLHQRQSFIDRLRHEHKDVVDQYQFQLKSLEQQIALHQQHQQQQQIQTDPPFLTITDLAQIAYHATHDRYVPR
jgi:hypothetical protein